MKTESISYDGIAWLLLVGLLASASFAADQRPASAATPPTADSGLYMKVQLPAPVKLSKLKPGDVVEGSLLRDVYSQDHELFSAGNRVRLTVDSLEKRRRAKNDHWPWVVNMFTPRHEKFPVFKTATVSSTSGEAALRVTMISVSRMREIRAQARKNATGSANSVPSGTVETSKSESKKNQAPVLVLEAFGAENQPQASGQSAGPDVTGLETLPAGTGCKILLLGDISASKSKPDDLIEARLLEPVSLNSRVVIPAGSFLEGKVLKKTPPRWGSRAGSLSITFTGLTLPGGNRIPIAASLTGAELDQKSHTRIDAEGKLQGEHPGKAWMAINIGVSAGLGKVSDDTMQLIIEAIVSTATDVSTAGAGRIASGVVAGVFMVTRHGRDVVIPRFTEMKIALDRPLSITRSAASLDLTAPAHGN